MLTRPDVDGPATLAEISQLWWFADGAIMDAGTRTHLHRSWGLCTRHAWMYFRVETQLRYHPLGNAVLMADLVSRAAHLVASPHSTRHKRATLESTESCFTCDYIAASPAGVDRFSAQLNEVNRGSQTADWCREAQHVWQSRMCSACAPRSDVAGAVSCRMHMLTGESSPDAARDYLAQLAERLTVCQKSLTFDGPARTPDSDAALVEGLGWCAGWRPEIVLRTWS